MLISSIMRSLYYCKDSGESDVAFHVRDSGKARLRQRFGGQEKLSYRNIRSLDKKSNKGRLRR
ncbi:MAG: hypothetical protein WBA93_10020 [Microcoleaceae cyanobacterium]